MKIAAVSYLNTVPMVYGIARAIESGELDGTEVVLSPPSGCAAVFAAGAAQVALLPSAALLELGIRNNVIARNEAIQLRESEIVTDYCIGASGDVRTVVIMSNSPIEKVRRLYVDSHSLTSVALSRILCRELWHIAPQRVPMGDMAALPAAMDGAEAGDAFLLIGDKVFDCEGRFEHSYDLARAWRELTGLPFVFAVWVACEQADEEFIERLNAALRYGAEHIPQAVAASAHAGRDYAVDYLTRNIDFRLDEAKRRSLALFLEKSLSL